MNKLAPLALYLLSVSWMCSKCLSCTCQPQTKSVPIQQLVSGAPGIQGGHSAYSVYFKTPVMDQDFTYKIVSSDGTYYHAVVVQPYKFHGGITTYLPTLGSSSMTNDFRTTGLVTQPFLTDMITHENWHVSIYQSYLDVYTALENWSANYQSGDFRSEDDAKAAVEKDKKTARNLAARYDKKMVHFQNEHPDPGGRSNGQVWGSINPDWGKKWLAIVQMFNAKFKTTGGSPMQ